MKIQLSNEQLLILQKEIELTLTSSSILSKYRLKLITFRNYLKTITDPYSELKNNMIIKYGISDKKGGYHVPQENMESFIQDISEPAESIIEIETIEVPVKAIDECTGNLNLIYKILD